MKVEVQEALLYLLKGKNRYVKLKFGKFNYGLHTHACRAVKTTLKINIIISASSGQSSLFQVYWKSYLQSWPRWHTRAHSVQQQREPVRPQVRHSKMSWLMCSVPVQVNEHVSLQHSTWRGEASGWLSDGHTMDIRTFLSICPLGLVARHWAVVNRVRAAWYVRPRTAAINGVQPSVSLPRRKMPIKS